MYTSQKKIALQMSQQWSGASAAVENIYNVTLKIVHCDVKCTLNAGCGEKRSANGPIAARTAVSAALLGHNLCLNLTFSAL